MIASPPRRLLIVDDNEDVADTLAELLRLSGAEVLVAHRGPDALTIGAEFAPDTILLDLAMPLVDGYEVARRIRQEPWGRSVFLIAVSGWQHPIEQDRAAGFDHTLLKPAMAEELEAVLGLSLPPHRTSN